MIFYLTNKVKTRLLGTKAKLAQETSKDAWHVTMDEGEEGGKIFIFTHIATAYTVVLFDVYYEDGTETLEQSFKEALRESLLFDGFKPSVVDVYLRQFDEFDYRKTTDRKAIAQTGDRKQLIEIYYPYYPVALPYSTVLNHKVNGTPVKAGLPLKLMYDSLIDIDDKPVTIKVYTIDIRIELTEDVISRKLDIPFNTTMNDLHMILQKAFGWLGRHLYAFIDKTHGKMYEAPDDIDEVFSTPEIYHTTLKSMFEDSAKWTYLYDYGDNWQHEITLLDTRAEDSFTPPVCLDYHNDNPVEDIGGVEGYETMMEILKNSNHPEYRAMKDHYRELHEPFDIHKLNNRLRAMASVVEF